MALSPTQYKFHGIAWWDCERGSVMVGALTALAALAFGAWRSPANWGRLVTLLMTIAWHHFYLLLLAYVDDTNCVEPALSAESARAVWLTLIELLRLRLGLQRSRPSTRWG